MVDADLVVIGAGIVGLAAAREYTRRHPARRLILLEKERRCAAHQSSHNSGVIHTGVHYAPGSVKALTCVPGAAAMLAFCTEEGIPVRVCGKLIVATRPAQVPRIEELRRRGEANGVRGLRILDGTGIRRVEPSCRGVAALHVPDAAVTDYALVTKHLADIVKRGGGIIRMNSRVIGLRADSRETIIETTTGIVSARRVLNCAGLHSDRILRLAGVRTGVRIVPFRGDYHRLGPRWMGLIHGLIYPVPDAGLPFLGAHLTKTVDGHVQAGPNAVLAFHREGYRRWDVRLRDLLDIFSHAGFYRMAARHWRKGAREMVRSMSRRALLRPLREMVPELRPADLLPCGSGVRAQAVDPRGGLVDDFRMLCSPGMVHVLNVPSPAATASLVIAGRIVDMLDAMG